MGLFAQMYFSVIISAFSLKKEQKIHIIKSNKLLFCCFEIEDW